MQGASDKSYTGMALTPPEILSMILSHVMRSTVPFYLDHFQQLGRQLEDFGQLEHFKDWLLINSTCRGFRARGKELFFSEKVCVIRPPLMKTLCGATSRISPENLSIARACIRHVIAPSPGDAASQLITLPRYHTLQNLRSLSIQLCRDPSEVLSISNLPTVKRKPLPEEFSTLLGNIGLRVDQLQVDLLYVDDEGELQTHIECLAKHVYPYLRTLSAWRAKARIQG